MLAFLVSLSTLALDYGIDRLSEETVAAKLSGKNLAVLTHAAGKNKLGLHLIDSLNQNFTLKKIFAPEHGLHTMAEDLKGIDAIVIDLQDVGVRYYNYFSTIAEVMKATASLNVEVIILDRPNLLGGLIMEGKVLDSSLAGSFTAYHTVPTRHGMTLGELALLINAEKKSGPNSQ